MADPAFDIVFAGSGVTPVTAGGTITFQYPAQRARASYMGQFPALMNVRANQANYTELADFAINYGSSNIVVTYNGSVPIPANTQVYLQLPLRDTSDQPVVNGYSLPASLEPDGR